LRICLLQLHARGLWPCPPHCGGYDGRIGHRAQSCVRQIGHAQRNSNSPQTNRSTFSNQTLKFLFYQWTLDQEVVYTEPVCGSKWGKVGALFPTWDKNKPKVGDVERMFLGEYAHTIDDKGRLTLPTSIAQIWLQG
jgi:hypothetical protein